MIIRFSPLSLARPLGGVAALLFIAHMAGAVARFRFGQEHRSWIWWLDVNVEHNLAAWFSASILLLAAALLALVTVDSHLRRDALHRYWAGLSLIFLYLSVDEALAIHERLSIPTSSIIAPEGIFFFTWVVPGMLLVAAVGVVFVRFLRMLPSRITRLFLMAGALYVSGALGMEMLGGFYAERNGTETLAYGVMVGFEELFEMSGVVLFLYGIAAYAGSRHDQGMTIQFADPTAFPHADYTYRTEVERSRGVP